MEANFVPNQIPPTNGVDQITNAILTEYQYLRNEDLKTKDRIQIVIIQSFIFIGVAGWFGWTNLGNARDMLSVLIFTVFIPFICCCTLIILMSCHLRSTEICLYTMDVENKLNGLLSTTQDIKPIDWIRTHYLENGGKGFEKYLLRADAGGAAILFLLIYSLSIFIGYNISVDFETTFFVSVGLSVCALIGTGICAIKALRIHDTNIKKKNDVYGKV